MNVAAGGFAVIFTKGSTTPNTQLALFDLVTNRRRQEWLRGAKTSVG